MTVNDDTPNEDEVVYPDDEPLMSPSVGQREFLIYWDKEDKIFKGGNYEFTEDGKWTQI